MSHEFARLSNLGRFAAPTAIAALAQRLEDDPTRLAEMKLYYEKIIDTLDETHDEHVTLDALALFEALALTLAQLIAALPDAERVGVLAYVTARAEHHAPEFVAAGKAAAHVVEGA